MFSKPAEPRSIASQLVLRFTPATAFLLFCALGVLYWIVVRHAFEEDNDVLADKILALRADMSKSGGPQTLNRELKNLQPGERVAYWVRILNSAGQLVAVLALSIVASAVIARRVARDGLQPLSAMTRSLKRIGPKRLHERIPPGAWPRELQPLATAFDEMLARLEDSFTRLSQFSADLAHELRTPIANIRGEAEVALTRPRSPDEYREVIESTVAECEKLSGIVDNLLFLARAEAAERNVQRTSFDGRAVIEKLAAFYEAIAQEQEVTLTCVGEGEIRADPMLFGRAVSNLVENALRFTPPGGTILISLVTRAEHCEISVKDTGCGIGAEHLPRVFDRFYRADSSRSSQGSGLGLALVKSIADLHDGSAKIESEVGRGTIVTLTFPGTV